MNTEYTAAIDQQQLNAPLFATAFRDLTSYASRGSCTGGGACTTVIASSAAVMLIAVAGRQLGSFANNDRFAPEALALVGADRRGSRAR